MKIIKVIPGINVQPNSTIRKWMTEIANYENKYGFGSIERELYWNSKIERYELK